MAKPEETPTAELDQEVAMSSFHDGMQMSLPREILFVILVCFAMICVQSGLALSVMILRYIGDDFGVSNPAELSWCVAAYSLTVGSFVLPAGKLGDIYGHKHLFICGWIWFCISSIMAGLSSFSNSIIFFDVCRALQGIGCATILSCGLALLGRCYRPGARQHLVFALFAACAPNGFVFGAALTSTLAQLADWTWAYYLFGIIGATLAALSIFGIPSDPPRDQHLPFDYAGTLVGISGLCLFNFAWNQAPVVGWSTSYVYALLIISILLGGLFIYIEHRATAPLVPGGIWTPQLAMALGCVGLGWASFGIWNLYSIQILQEIRGDSVLLVAAKSVPFCFSGLAAALTTARILPIIGPEITMLIAMLAFLTGIVLITTSPAQQSYWAQFFPSYLIAPFGMDMSFPAGAIIASHSLPREQQGLASSLINTIVNYSISVGLGFAGTAEAYTAHGDEFHGYRSALYVGVGLASLGVLLAVCNVVYSLRERLSNGEAEKHEK